MIAVSGVTQMKMGLDPFLPSVEFFLPLLPLVCSLGMNVYIYMSKILIQNPNLNPKHMQCTNIAPISTKCSVNEHSTIMLADASSQTNIMVHHLLYNLYL